MCADPARQWSEACDALYVATVASTPDDKARLRWIAENACDSRVGEACGMLGNWAEDEHGADSPESVVYYQRACEYGNGLACGMLGKRKDAQSGRGSRESIAYYEQACEKGFGDACVELFGMFHNGDGVPEDKTRARSYMESLCESGQELEHRDVDTCMVFRTMEAMGK